MYGSGKAKLSRVVEGYTIIDLKRWMIEKKILQ
jgi:hypothetical protein